VLHFWQFHSLFVSYLMEKYKVFLLSLHQVWQLYCIESLPGHPVTAVHSCHRTARKETHCNWSKSTYIVLCERKVLMSLIIFGAAFLKFALYFQYWNIICNNKGCMSKKLTLSWLNKISTHLSYTIYNSSKWLCRTQNKSDIECTIVSKLRYNKF
jgi:hypothetical protein